MLINALNDYYEILAAGGKVCPDGLSRQKISHMIMLRTDGTISDIVDIRRETEPDSKGKTRLEPVELMLPARTQKPGIDFNIIEHRPLYIFGLNYSVDKESKRGSLSPDDKTDKAKKSHDCFVKANLEFTEGMTSEIVLAYRNFLLKWEPGNETENRQILGLGKEYDKGYYCFCLDGHPEITLHDPDGEIMKKWMSSGEEAGCPDGVCAISGKPAVIARIHDKIKGIKGGQAAGCTLVCVNNESEESYTKTQSYNSSISQEVMKHYTETLNILLADPHHRMYIEDMTVVFLAMSKNDDAETDLLMSMLGGGEPQSAEETDAMLMTAIKEVAQGRNADLSAFSADGDVIFYIVGLSPNNSRIAQKFIYRDKFGSIFNNVARHQADMMLDGINKQIPIWRMLIELKSPKSKNDRVSQPLIAAIFTAIMNGTRYPDALLETAVRRVKIDKSVNAVRAGMIKACVNRKSRFNRETEEIKMSLDKENSNSAYLCGRLFAALERVQKNAAGTELNRTIKDSFFSSACAKPSSVFPRLMVLAQHHLGKDEYAKNDNWLISEIMDKLGGEFPQTLPLTEQGKFIIGYYQQYQDFFVKHNNEDN